MTGTLLVLSGPSGVGKSTVVAAVRKQYPDLEFSISCTTRKPRAGETDGVHYYFVSHEEFARRVERGAFLEHAEVFANCYGTLRSEVEERLRAGRDVCLDIDVQGAMQIRKAIADDSFLRAAAEFVFLVPPSLGELESRLRGRATDSEEQIALRLGKARTELGFWREYDYLVVNDRVEHAVEEFSVLLRAFRMKSSRRPEGWLHE